MSSLINKYGRHYPKPETSTERGLRKLSATVQPREGSAQKLHPTQKRKVIAAQHGDVVAKAAGALERRDHWERRTSVGETAKTLRALRARDMRQDIDAALSNYQNPPVLADAAHQNADAAAAALAPATELPAWYTARRGAGEGADDEPEVVTDDLEHKSDSASEYGSERHDRASEYDSERRDSGSEYDSERYDTERDDDEYKE